MSTVRGHLNSFIRFSAVDGPGNRFVLFLQGCNFDCIACHNPYMISVCSACGDCIEPCPEHALSLVAGPAIALDASLCTDCDKCLEVCPENSTPLARYVTVDEVLDEMRKTAPFISGVTVSGGEATLQAEFVAALFAAIKDEPGLRRLTTFVDSNGAAPPAVWDLLLGVMDGAMIDLKALDPDTHRTLTGASNDEVLDTIAYLAPRGRLYEVRLLLIPGYNDDPDTIAKTASWLRAVDPDMRIRITGFRRHGVRPAARDLAEPEPARVAAIGADFRDYGFADVIAH